jgi:hypothetical protein
LVFEKILSFFFRFGNGVKPADQRKSFHWISDFVFWRTCETWVSTSFKTFQDVCQLACRTYSKTRWNGSCRIFLHR